MERRRCSDRFWLLGSGLRSSFFDGYFSDERGGGMSCSCSR